MKYFPLMVLISFVLIQSTISQEKLTLQQAIQTALDKNISVIGSKYTSQIKEANVTTAYGNFIPSLSASARWSRNGASPSSFSRPAASGSVSAGVNADVILFDGFRNTSTLSGASASADAAKYDYEKTKQDIVLAVQQAYLTVLRNKQLLTVNEDNLKRSKQQLSRIEESNKVGAVAKADLFRQQVQTANDELALINAQSNLDNSKNDLLYLISLDVTKDYDFEDVTVGQQIESLKFDSLQQEHSDYNKLVDEAIQTRPDYQSAVLAKNVAQNNLTIARSGHFPTLSLGGSYGYGGADFSTLTDTKTWDIGLTFSVPIFSGFQTSTAVQTNQLNLELADQTLDQAKRKVGKDVKTALLSLETARKRYDVSVKNVVSAEEDRRIAEERYNLGSNTLLDLLIANANYTQAQSDKVNASYDFIYAKQQFRIAVGRDKY